MQGELNLLFEKYPDYRELSSYKSLQEIFDALEMLLEDHFDQTAYVDVPQITLEKIIKNMAVCCPKKISPQGKTKGELVENTLYNIEQRIDNKIKIVEIPASDTTRIMRRFQPGSLRPYVDGWDMKTNLEFCISAGMSYERALDFTVNMMGMPWLYLRNTEHLVGDFCLRFGLGPKEYYHLSQIFADIEKETREHNTECTGVFVKDYEELCAEIEMAKQEECLRSEDLCEELEIFARNNKIYLFGHNQRAVRYIRNLILCHKTNMGYAEKYFGKVKIVDGKVIINKSRLAEHLAVTTFPWECKYQGEFLRKNKDSLIYEMFESESNKSRSVKKRIEKYMEESKTVEDINYFQMRTDMIRLLLINGMSDIQKINCELEMYSFFALDARLPFDFLVLSILMFHIKKSEWNKSVEKDPYGKIEEFFKEFGLA